MSDPRPAWLPAPIPFGGDWDTFVRTLYGIFEVDFKTSRPRFRGCAVWHDRRVEADDKFGFEEGFWHLISRDQWVFDRKTRRNEKQRLPELTRAGRLPWARPTIDYETDPVIRVWNSEAQTKRGPSVRTNLWIVDWDYHVVLERQATLKFGDVFMLITSYMVDMPGQREKLNRSYENRLKK